MTANALVAALLVAVAGVLLSDAGQGRHRLRSLGSPQAPESAALAARLQADGGPRRATAAGPALAALVTMVLDGVVLALVVGVVSWVLLRRWAASRQRAIAQRSRHTAVAACETFAEELRAGRSPADALDVAARLVTELGSASQAVSWQQVTVSVRMGADPRPGSPDGPAPGTGGDAALQQLVACWQVSSRTGTGLAAAGQQLAESLRAEERHRNEVAAQLAGARTTAGLLAGLPLLGIVLAAGLGADPIRVLLDTSLGAGCLLAGVTLDLLGLSWTDRLVARAASGQR